MDAGFRRWMRYHLRPAAYAQHPVDNSTLAEQVAGVLVRTSFFQRLIIAIVAATLLAAALPRGERAVDSSSISFSSGSTAPEFILGVHDAHGKAPVGSSWIKLNLVSIFWGHRPPPPRDSRMTLIVRRGSGRDRALKPGLVGTVELRI
jgi:hypothetical protein